MSRSAERWVRPLTATALAVGLTLGPGSTASAQQDPPPPDAQGAVEDVVGPVEDVVGPVESLDGTEVESREGRTVTVALTSDVLFAFDRADLTPQAQDRLQGVAEQITADAAGGVVAVRGHTDDQGSDEYNDDLSLRRADAVENALGQLLAGKDVTFEASGHGEREPRLPNIVDGQPNEENRAKNRRVEIVYEAGG